MYICIYTERDIEEVRKKKLNKEETYLYIQREKEEQKKSDIKRYIEIKRQKRRLTEIEKAKEIERQREERERQRDIAEMGLRK